MDELLVTRKDFPILENTTYLISHSLGAMPRRVHERLQEYSTMWAERGIRAWSEGWWEMPLRVGDLVGRIIGAPPGSVCMHQNVSVGESVLASCFEFTAKRNKVVYSEMNFPSVMYVWEERRRLGARIEVVPSDDGITVDTQRMIDAIDETTLVVPISHVLFESGYIQDAHAIIEKAHRVGAYVILDVYQSAGTVPLDVTKLNTDFAVGGSVKWLCGGPGAGYLYVRPDLQEKFRPAVTGWMAHDAPFAFEPGPIRYAKGIARYLHGSPAIAPLFAATPGYESVLAVGVDAIRKKSMRQTARLIESAKVHGLTVHSPLDPAKRGGTVVLDVANGQAVASELIRREILVDFRPGAGIRIGPHFYTSDDECDRVVNEIAEILETKAYERHASKGAVRH
ncbi:MAG: aminotransferase class V-fold PLP-dependent enzyme [Planctomycetes bacterium]|nr:aminotransferase class V-fold PLP-dependent enzyme [Planctomycetota bacterium]